MKLHLPSLLRKALLACFAAVSAFTFASGSAWGETYNLLSSADNWTLGSGYSQDTTSGAISKSGAWGGVKSATYSSGFDYYTVSDESNTLTFSFSFSTAATGGDYNTGGAINASASNSVLTFALSGTKTIIIGADEYNSTAFGYGVSSDTTASTYGGTDLQLTDFSMTRAWGTNYTVEGTVTLSGGTYSLVVSLGDGTNTYTSGTIDLGDTFVIERFVMSSEGGTDTLSALSINGKLVEQVTYSTSISGTVEASSATWQKDGSTVDYAAIPKTDGSVVLEVSGEGDGAVLSIAENMNIWGLDIAAGTVALKLEDGVTLTVGRTYGISGIQMDDGESATISDSSIAVAGPILSSGSTAVLTLDNTDLILSGDRDMHGTVQVVGENTLAGGRLTIKDGATMALTDGSSFTRLESVAYWIKGTLKTQKDAVATFDTPNDIHLDYTGDDTTANGAILLEEGSTMNLNVASGYKLQGYNEALVDLKKNSTLNFSGAIAGTVNFSLEEGSMLNRSSVGLLATGGEGSLIFSGDSDNDGCLAAGATHSFDGTIDVAAGQQLKYGNDQEAAVTADNLAVSLAEGSSLYVNSYQSTLSELDVQGNATLKAHDSSGSSVVALTIGEVKIATGKTLGTQTTWEGMVRFESLNAEGDLNSNFNGASPLFINAIAKSGNITNRNANGVMTLGEAGANSVLSIGGTITNAGTLVLADSGVSFNVSSISDFKGTIEYDANALWDYNTNAASTTGNGFATKSGNMQIIANTGTVKVGADGEALTDLSSLTVTYNGQATTMTADGKVYGSSDEVLPDYVVAGTGENATVALSAINAEAEKGNTAWEKIILRDNTTLSVDENVALSVDNIEYADTAQIRVEDGVSVTASGSGEGTYSANYISAMTGTGTLLVNHDTLIGGSGMEFSSDFAGQIDVADGCLDIQGQNVELESATINLNGGIARFEKGQTVKIGTVSAEKSSSFGINMAYAENCTVSVDSVNVNSDATLRFGSGPSTQVYWGKYTANIKKLLGEGDIALVSGYYREDDAFGGTLTYNIDSVGTQDGAFGNIVLDSQAAYQSDNCLVLNLGADSNSMLNVGDVQLGKGTINIKGILMGKSTISNPDIVLADDVTVTGDITMASAFTQAEGKTLTVSDGGKLTVGAATSVGTLAVNDGGELTIGAATSVGTLTVGNAAISANAALTISDSLTLSDTSRFVLDLGKATAGTPIVTASNYDGALTLALSGLTAGTYDLFQAAAGISEDSVTLLDAGTGTAFGSGRSSVELSVTDTGLVQATVALTGVLSDLVWETADENNVWSSGGAANWTSATAGADQQFFNGDTVSFDGTGETITISGTVLPAAITVSGTGYVFTGDGSIGGASSLTVTKDGELTIETSNTYTGGTTIAEGGKLTITNVRGMGGAQTDASLGQVSGAGTLVLNIASGGRVHALGTGATATLNNFEGVIEVQKGIFQIGAGNTSGTGAGATFDATKVIVGNGATFVTHFGVGESADETQKGFASAIDLISGATLQNIDGFINYNGAIRFNIMDPSATTPAYDGEGVVDIKQYWQKTLKFTGKIEGDGIVQLAHPSAQNKAVYSITGSNNTFAGTYTTIDDDGVSDSKIIELRLGTETAASAADVNLATTTAKSYLMLDSDATINGLYGGEDAENAVQAQGGNRTLTVTEGDFGGCLMDSGSNILSLTKQGTADTTLIFRGANSYTGETVVNGGTLELAAGATLASARVALADEAQLVVHEGSYSTSVDGAGTLVKKGAGDVFISGLHNEFAGTIDLQEGTLKIGDSFEPLELSTGRTLQAGANGVVLDTALSLNGGTLALDYTTAADTTPSMLSLNGKGLTLDGASTLSLSGLSSLDTTQENTIDLLLGLGSLTDNIHTGSDFSAGVNASDYFSTISGLSSEVDPSTLKLQTTVDGALQLVIPEQVAYLDWSLNNADNNGLWRTNGPFGDEATEEFNDAHNNVRFGEITGDATTEEVTIANRLNVGKMIVDAGEGKTYEFTNDNNTANYITAVESISLESGTAAFGAGVLYVADSHDAATITVKDGATLSLANGAIVNADRIGIVLNDGGTLSLASDYADTFASSITVADGSEVNLISNNTGVGMSLTNVVQGDGETATFNLSGANFSLDSEDLHGNINLGNKADGSGITVNLLSSSTAFDQNFSGTGGLTAAEGQGNIYLSGNNTYSGTTVIDTTLIIQGAQALSANTTLTGGGGEKYLFLCKAEGEETATFNLATDNSSKSGITIVGSASDNPAGTVTGVTLNLLTGSTLGGDVYVKAGNAADLAVGAAVTGAFTVYGAEDGASAATLTLHEGVTNGISGAGTVKIDGDITWNNANKTYTGETQVLAGSTLTAAAPLTGGAGKVQLMAGTDTAAAGTLIITNSTNWANKVYGEGTLMLGTTVNNLEAIVDGGADAAMLSTAYVGVQTTDPAANVAGTLVIDDAAAADSAAKIQNLVVNAGSSLNVSTTGDALKIGQSLTLSGAGDAAAADDSGKAALAITTTSSGETKIASDITLAANTTIYVAQSNGQHRLNGSFDGAGYTLTKTGAGWLGLGAFASGSTNDLSGELNIQGGTVELVGMGTADARQAIGKTTLADGTTLRFYSGQYAFAEGLDFAGDATLNIGAGATATVTGNVSGSGVVTMSANNAGTLTLAAANDFSGTWKLDADAWTLALGHTDAAKNAILQTSGGGKIMLVGDTEYFSTVALSSTGTAGEIMTENTGITKYLHVYNTTGEEATFGGMVHGGVIVQLKDGEQKFTGTLDNGTTFVAEGGTLSIASENQTGTHTFIVDDGVLDMAGYTRAANAKGADKIDIIGDGQVNNLKLAAGMEVGLIDHSKTITLGGITELGAGTLNFLVTDSSNMMPTGSAYKLTDTLYKCGSGDILTLVGTNNEVTHLSISLENPDTDTLDPNPDPDGNAPNADYRDHKLISGISFENGLELDVDGTADASDFFSTNLNNSGRTQYNLLFVQNAESPSLYDLVLRAKGAAANLYWDEATGGTWNTTDTNLAWQTATGTPPVPDDPKVEAAFKTFDYVYFDDLTTNDGPVSDVTITVDDNGVQMGGMWVQSDTTNYTFEGGSIGSMDENAGAALYKTGASTLTLKGNNGYVGNTYIGKASADGSTVPGGVVIVQHDGALSNTTTHLYYGTLVLDFQNQGTDGELDSMLAMYGGNTLQATQDATVRIYTSGSDKKLLAANGKTLTLKPSDANDNAGTSIAGKLYINSSDGYTGTVAMVLEDGVSYSHNESTFVNRGSYQMVGSAGTQWTSTGSLNVQQGATARIQGGMTLQTQYLEGANGTYGSVSLEDASKLVLTSTTNRTINTAVTSEGATMEIQNAATVMTLKDLTIVGEDGANGKNRTLLKGGTWVLQQGAVQWADGASAALAVGANTTVKVNDDTLKHVRVANTGAVLTTAKADGSNAALEVGKIEVSSGGAINGVDLTITGMGSIIQGSVAGVTVQRTGTIDLERDAAALTFGKGSDNKAWRSNLDSLDIVTGKVQVTSTSDLVIVKSGVVTISGEYGALDMSQTNKLTKEDGTTAVDITMNAGAIYGAHTYSGTITVDDLGEAKSITLKNLSNAAKVKLAGIETEDGVTTLTGMQNVTLADGSELTLSSNLAEGQGNLVFDFAENAAADAAVSMASGGSLTLNVNGVLGDVLDAEGGSVSYTLADDRSIAALADAVQWDATLRLYNITASFGTDGKLTLSRAVLPLPEDSIYRSSVNNQDDGNSDQWGGNGPNVYTSADAYTSVYIDKDTVIDLTEAAPTTENGLVLSNLVGRGNGATLTIDGSNDGDVDVVTINNNLDAAALGTGAKSLSFNGDIVVKDTTLQLLNTVATPGAENAGELDTESVYQVNGALKMDETSPLKLSAGILKLNGKGSNASELRGGVSIAEGDAQLQVSGAAAVGGTLAVTNPQDDTDADAADVLLADGGRLTLLPGATVAESLQISGEGEGRETLSVANDATVSMAAGSSVSDVVLELHEGSKLVLETGHKGMLIDGLDGSGALQASPGTDAAGGTFWPAVNIAAQKDSIYSGDLSGFDGRIVVDAAGTATQVFDKVTTAAAGSSKVDMELSGITTINVAEESGNKTLNLSGLVLQSGSGTTLEVNADALASGAAPALTVSTGAGMDNGAALLLSSNTDTVLGADAELLLMTGTDAADLSGMDGKSIALDVTDNAFRRLSETATLSVVNGKVLVNFADSETNRYADAVSESNAVAGAELLWGADVTALDADSALKAVDQAVADLLKAGNTAEAEEVLAATAGAGTAVLGAAFSADVERQLRAIRNRTTTMGVNQCEVNEGMPYVNAWINAEGDHRELDADGLAAGYTLDSWGGTVGFDVDLTNKLTMGLAVTAMYGDVEADGPDKAEGDFDTQYVSLFARVAHKAWVHTFVATIGRADVSLDRTVSFPGGAYETTGETDGMGYGLMYEVARTFTLSEDGSTCWQPVFNVAWRHSSIDGYSESGSDAALEVGDQDMNVLTFGAGARLQSVIGENLYNRASLFEARALVKVDAGDREGEAEVALLGGGNSATVTAAEVGAVGVEIGAGVTIPVGMNAGSVFIDGSAEFRSGYTNVNGTVGYRFNF